MTFVSKSEKDTEALGARLARSLPEGGAVIAMYGELGAGKTRFVQGVARALGIQAEVTSPTFTILNIHEGTDLKLYHFDLYRLDDPEEFYEAGLEEYAFGNGAAVIEWPDCAELMPDTCFEVEINRGASDDEREITVTPMGDVRSRIAEIEAAGENWRKEA